MMGARITRRDTGNSYSIRGSFVRRYAPLLEAHAAQCCDVTDLVERRLMNAIDVSRL